MNTFDNLIKNHFYINLDSRTDRRESCENELKKWYGDAELNRFSAIRPPLADCKRQGRRAKPRQGIIGCGMSHLACIREAKEKGWEYCAIFEDDIMIPKPTQVRNTVNRILESGEEWDILLLSGNAFKPHKRVEEDFIQVQRCYTTTAYIIKNSFFDTWIENLKESIEGLMRTGDRNYSLDAYWGKLMIDNVFLLILPPTIYQKPDHSDIEERFVDYKNAILNINK
jgi:GR25 family glycosyltransferase involved in LPS biosynthesis